jgi:dTDP-3,4-didehydro-2,6-dideoxy-alpha-D-glucose 3-reductase
MALLHNQSDDLKIALWGVGDHARRNILPAIQSCSGIQLAGITTRNKVYLDSEADKWHCQSWAKPQDMLQSGGFDVVYISTPNGLHFDHVKQCLEAGYHVLCEKSLTVDLSQTLELMEHARQRNLLLSVACAPIYHQQFKQLQDMIKRGDIGQLRHITARFGFPHKDSKNIRYNPELGGGAYLDIAFYLLYMSELLAGSPLEDVSCAMEQEIGYDVDTSGSASLVFANKVTAKLEWGYGQDYVNDLKIDGEKGSLYVKPAFSKPQNIPAFIEYNSAGGTKMYETDGDNQQVKMLEEFRRAIWDKGLGRELSERAVRTQTLLEEGRKANGKRVGT